MIVPRLLVLYLLLLAGAALPAQLVGDEQRGLASYYSREYEGAETAYGVIYDKDELVAAHKVYPFGSHVRVQNTENGRSVDVRIVDKGPFIRGRVIELSERAATELDMIGQRTVPVTVTLLSTPDQPAAAPPPPPEPARIVATPPPAREADARPRSPTPQAIPPKRPSPTPAPTPRVEGFTTGLYRVALEDLSTRRTRYGVQVGSFRKLERAMDRVAELRQRHFDDILLHKLPGDNGPTSYIYKVVLGPFDDHESAANYASSLKKRYRIEGFTVELRP